MTPRCSWCALVVSIALAALPASAQVGGEAAPQGFNLGPIGAKVDPVPAAQRAQYGLSSGQSGLVVLSVADGQCGQLAGLAPGDVIIGTAAGVFTDKRDPVYQLATAIEPLYARAPKPEPAMLNLLVWRAGKVVPLKVGIAGRGPGWADALMEESLAYMLKQQDDDGGFPTPMGGNNGKVAVTALCGLALLAGGGVNGPNAEPIRRAKDYLFETTGVEGERMGAAGGANWSQVNWSLGYGCLFLAEYATEAPDIALTLKLTELCRQIEHNQEENGGWSHGPGGPNALGYTDFAAVSNVVLAGYGAAGKAKVKLVPPVIAKATSYLIATASGDGGIGYSQRSGQKGNGDPGRTAATMFAFAMCGQSAHPFFGRMASYFKRNIGDVPEGHASPVYHFGLGALGSYEANLAPEFLAMFRHELLMARNADGSFSPRPSQESKEMRTSSDDTMGPCWTTGTYLLVWNLGRGKLSLYGKKAKRQ